MNEYLSLGVDYEQSKKFVEQWYALWVKERESNKELQADLNESQDIAEVRYLQLKICSKNLMESINGEAYARKMWHEEATALQKKLAAALEHADRLAKALQEIESNCAGAFNPNYKIAHETLAINRKFKADMLK